MGCALDKCFDVDQEEEAIGLLPRRGRPWKSDHPLTKVELDKMRDDFWFSTRGTEGRQEVWETLKAACEADDETCDVILEAAGIKTERGSLESCYDELGAKYEIPIYCIREPTNMSNKVSTE